MDKEQTIHWFGCWREHHECALARIENLERAVREYCDHVDKVKAKKSSYVLPSTEFAYVTFKELLADNEEERGFWAVTRDNLLAAREAVRQALED